MGRRPRSARELARQALARRDLSEHGLRERLARAGMPEGDVEHALTELRRAGIVDDGRFAVARAQSLAERGKGDAAIRFDLTRQGVDADAIERAIAELEPERERLEELVRRRGASPATARLLAGRGFDEDAIRAAVAREGSGEIGYEGLI